MPPELDERELSNDGSGTGGTGNLGRHLVERTLLMGRTVRVLTRDAGVTRLPGGVETVEGDLEQPSSLVAALDGVDAVPLLSTTGAAHTPLRAGRGILTMAAEAGMRRITVLSPREGQELDETVRGRALERTFLWPVDLMANALGWADAIHAEGRVREPYGGRRTSSVHGRDVADVVSTILTNAGHAGRSYVLTGPRQSARPARPTPSQRTPAARTTSRTCGDSTASGVVVAAAGLLQPEVWVLGGCWC
ncbi:NAD(P)H-binding protein [Streptomyces sp. NPDC002057]|uniref:SDR family oxidoreductase n=1 Tax=Streptomyces sp. NPDC002057 TaxID=3154664 RepID=UPI0033213C53